MLLKYPKIKSESKGNPNKKKKKKRRRNEKWQRTRILISFEDSDIKWRDMSVEEYDFKIIYL